MCVAAANQTKTDSCPTDATGTSSEGYFLDTCAGYGLVTILQNPNRLILQVMDQDGVPRVSYTVPDTMPTPTPTPTPTPPSDLTASAMLAGQRARVALSWKDHSTNETGFELDRCSGLGCSNFQLMAAVAANVVGYHDKSVTRATSYRYRVRATSNSGPSDYSNVATVTTP
jgi:hypothetical protein